MALSDLMGASVKSVQRGNATMAAGIQYLDIPIGAVNVAKAFALVSCTVEANDVREIPAHVLSATKLGFARYSTAGKADVNWQVVEFY